MGGARSHVHSVSVYEALARSGTSQLPSPTGTPRSRAGEDFPRASAEKNPPAVQEMQDTWV